MTQRELAERTALSQPAVSNLERGQGRMGLGTVLRVLAALRLELVLRERPRTSPAAPWTERD